MGYQEATRAGTETLGAGGFARRMYDLGAAQATGLLRAWAHDQALDLLALRRGRLLCPPSDLLGRQARLRLANLASRPQLRIELDPNARAHPPGGSHALCLSAWARQHIEAQLDARRAAELARELAGAYLRVPTPRAPASRILDATDQRILDALRAPTRLDRVAAQARAPRFRLMSFVFFLRQVGALEVQAARARRSPADSRPASRDTSDALRTLGVRPGAGPDELKRAYRRLVRSLHPDLHPHADEVKRRALERRLAEVNCAYHALSR